MPFGSTSTFPLLVILFCSYLHPIQIQHIIVIYWLPLFTRLPTYKPICPMEVFFWCSSPHGSPKSIGSGVGDEKFTSITYDSHPQLSPPPYIAMSHYHQLEYLHSRSSFASPCNIWNMIGTPLRYTLIGLLEVLLYTTSCTSCFSSSTVSSTISSISSVASFYAYFLHLMVLNIQLCWFRICTLPSSWKTHIF
jgi:hypothetical protein